MGQYRRGQTAKPSFRWVMSRKANVLSSIRSGRMTIQQACSTYAISLEELTTWEEAFQRLGPKGLYATRRNSVSPNIGSSDSP
jgi:hypothetical protein